VLSWYAYPLCLGFPLKSSFKVDEAHERSVYTDLLLAILKKFVALLGLARSLTPTDPQDMSEMWLIAHYCIVGDFGCHCLLGIFLIPSGAS
jgi:hypothetical protein